MKDGLNRSAFIISHSAFKYGDLVFPRADMDMFDLFKGYAVCVGCMVLD